MSVYVVGVRVLVYGVCVCLVSLGPQLSKAPSKSTWGHLESQMEGIAKQHNVQIQEAFTKVVFLFFN